MKKILVLAAVLFQCASMTQVHNPESREYPCGPLGVVCGGVYPHASCCWQVTCAAASTRAAPLGSAAGWGRTTP